MTRAAFTSQVTSRTVIKASFSVMKEIQMNYSFTMGVHLCLRNLMNFQMRELLVTDILLSIIIRPTGKENVSTRLRKLLCKLLSYKESCGNNLLSSFFYKLNRNLSGTQIQMSPRTSARQGYRNTALVT